MNKDSENLVRDLADALWKFAGQQPGMSIDNWLAAESMVRHAWTDIIKHPEVWAAAFTKLRPLYPTEAHMERQREIAFYMWEAAGQPVEMAIDFWLAARRHALAIMVRSIQRALFSVVPGKTMANEIEQFSVEDHFARIRQMAYEMWIAAGKQYGKALDYWLKAENQVLDDMQRRESER